MKKTLFTLIAFLATVTAFAQDNLALNATVTLGTEEGAEQTINGAGTTGNVVDGNEGTALQMQYTSGTFTSLILDLGEAKTFNTVLLHQTGDRNTTKFKVAVSSDGTSWTDVTEVTNVVPGKFAVSFTAQTAQYVKYISQKNDKNVNDQWGEGIAEIQLYNLDTPIAVSSIELTAASNNASVGETVNLTPIGIADQLSAKTTLGTITWNNTNPTVGTVADGVFTAAAAGTASITASANGKTSNAVEITVVAGDKIDLFTNWQYRIYTIGADTKSAGRDGLVDTNDGSLWELHATTGAGEADRTYETGFIADLGAIYDINSISIHFEGACSEAFGISFAGNDGVFGANVYNGGVAGISNHTEQFAGETVTGARYVKFLSTKASSEWGIKIYDFSVVGTKTADVTLNTPAITAGAVGATTEASIELNLTATNDNSAFVIYEVAANGVPARYYTANAGEATTITVDGLAAGTTYNFAIFAINAEGTRSAIKELSGNTSGETFVLTAAPTPDKDADKVLSIYSNAYTPATTYDYGGWGQSTVVATETVDGDELLKLTNYNYLGFEYKTDLDLSDMTYIHIDILPMENMDFGITPIMRGGTPTENSTSVGTLNVKEWNSIDLPLSTIGLDFANYASFQLKIDKGTGNTVYVDNIYFYHSDEEVPTPAALAVESTENGIVKLTGVWTDEDFETIDATEKATAYDLTEVTGDLNGKTINATLPNALFITTAAQNVAKNRVVKDGSGYTGYNIVLTENYDSDANKAKDYSVNTAITPINPVGQAEKSYYRAGAAVYGTTVAPFDVAADAGVDFYELSSSSEADGTTTLNFTKADNLNAGQAYLVYFRAAAAFWLRATNPTITWQTTGDTFKATFSPIAKADAGDVYVLDGQNNNTPKFAKNAFDIPAWRGYLSLPAASGAKINIVIDGNVADSIQAVENGLIESVFNVYSIDGKLVKANSNSMVNLNKGVYIINGKKVVVK